MKPSHQGSTKVCFHVPHTTSTQWGPKACATLPSTCSHPPGISEPLSTSSCPSLPALPATSSAQGPPALPSPREMPPGKACLLAGGAGGGLVLCLPYLPPGFSIEHSFCTALGPPALLSLGREEEPPQKMSRLRVGETPGVAP